MNKLEITIKLAPSTKIVLLVLIAGSVLIFSIFAIFGFITLTYTKAQLKDVPPFISGKVLLDNDGVMEPLSDMLVRLKTLPSGSDNPEEFIEYTFDANTDEKGEYIFQPVFPGNYRLEPIDLDEIYVFDPPYIDLKFKKGIKQNIDFIAE